MSEPVESSERVDPGKGAYHRAEIVEHMSDGLGWLAVVSFLAYTFLHAKHHEMDSSAKLAFVAFASASIAVGLYFRFDLQPAADRSRRLLMLSDSFGVALVPHRQVGYFTTSQAPSIYRLLHTLCENTFFYPRLLLHDLAKPITIVVLTLVGLLVSLRQGTAELVELFAVLVLFGDLGLVRLVRMLWMVREFRRLHEECYQALTFPRPVPIEVEALRLLGDYEAIKARGGVRASETTFERLNTQLTKEWASISAALPHWPLSEPSSEC